MTRVHRRALALAVTASAALALAPSAHAALTSPAAGSVQRGDVVITEAVGANVAAPCGSGTKTTVTVTNAAGEVVFTQTKSGVLLGAGAGALTATWNTAEAPNGTYTVTSSAVNRTKLSSLSCSAAGAPVTLSTATFELRKWQYRFVDARGKGTVYFNTSPKEAQIQLGADDTGVIPRADLQVISLPKDQSVALPDDPAACLADPAACTPSTPSSCDTDPADCEERLVIANIGADDTAYGLHGTFDLRTGAFAAFATARGHNEAVGNVGNACGEIRKQLADRGADPDTALGGTPVDATLPVELGTPTQVPTTAQALCAFAQAYAVASLDGATAGTGVNNTPEAGAGLIIHIATKSTSGKPTAPSALPYTITQSQTVPPLGDLPALPALPDLPALPVPETPAGVPALPSDPSGLATTLAPRGPLTQVKGTNYSSGTHIVGVLNADTAAGPDEQTPIWLPLTTAGSKPDKRLDYVGYGTATQGQTCFTLLGTQTCIGLGTVIGTGAALFGPAPLSLPVVP